MTLLLASAGAVLLALLFACAGAAKLRDRSYFSALIGQHLAGSPMSAPILTAMLGATELLIAGGLLLPTFRPVAAVGAFSLLALYALAIARQLRLGRRDLDCGCGSDIQALRPWMLLRNSALMVIALWVAWAGDAALGWPAACLSLVAGLFGWLAYRVLEQLPDNQERLTTAHRPPQWSYP